MGRIFIKDILRIIDLQQKSEDFMICIFFSYILIYDINRKM